VDVLATLEAHARHPAWALQPADEAMDDFAEFAGQDRQRTPARCDIRARVRKQLCSAPLMQFRMLSLCIQLEKYGELLC
jgi:hypothetical protein